MPRPPVVKRYSLFQRSVRVVQTSIRHVDRWIAVRVPGLPNPPEIEEKLRKPRFVDLWEFTLADHRRIFHEVWQEYKASFAGPSEEELEHSKEEVKRAVQAVRGQVSSTASKNLSFIDKKLEGTKAHDNLHTLSEQGAENVKFLTKEIKHVAEGVDTDAVVSHARQVVDDSRSKDDVATTLKKNVNELRHLAQEGRDAALNLEKQDVETFKTSAQSWFADKLLVGQSVLMAFIEGYREGKELELEREDALLITFAKQAAEDHKDILENQIKKVMDQQREKQRQEQEAAQKAGSSESKERPEKQTQEKPTSAVATEQQGDNPTTTDQRCQLIQTKMPQKEELVRLEKVHFAEDDDDDDTFQYEAVDDGALELGDDDDGDEEDFAAVLRNLNRSTIASGQGTTTAAASLSTVEASDDMSADRSVAGSPKQAMMTRVHTCTQVRPSVVDDFIRNFLIKLGLTRTLDMFNHEWYEFIAKGKLREDDVGVVPDIYVRNQALDDQVKELRRQLEDTRKITEKAKGTWDKFRHQRDVHKMHHQRVLQEKEALSVKIRKLEKHIAAYEPLLQELKAKYENSMKEKMLMRIERDRQVAKAEALEAQLKAVGGGSMAANTSGKGKQVAPVAPLGSTTSSSSKTASGRQKKKSKSKSDVPDTKLPSPDAVNPFVDKRFEPVNPERVEVARSCQAHANSVAAVAFHPKNPIVATVSDDETWKLWSAPAGELIMSGEGHRSWLSSVTFHPRGAHVATSSGDNTVKLWDFVGAACSLTLADHSHPVWESAFHHDGDFLVSASMDHTCKLWDLHSGRCRRTFRGHVDSVNSVCFQPFSTNICTGSGDKTVSIWDLRSGLCVQTFYGHQNACNSVAFALAGDTIASCDADGFVKAWDVRMVAERSSLDGGQHPLNSVAFDRSGKILAAASDDGSIKLFSMKTEALATELKGHEGPVQSVKFDPNGRFLASSSSDCTFRLWST
ncbi:Flagellar WD repeat-containing protein [Phytophthora idaei]|nr:Flagellar WD repeat-containing protein [Phytophthora idaei]